MSEALLEASGLIRDVPGRRILHGIALRVAPGETLGIIGASGSGKSTLARILMGLEAPSEGEVLFRGQDLFGPQRRSLRRHIQAVFQDPYSSLDPHQRIGAIIGEPLVALGVPRAARAARMAEALAAVALPDSAAQAFPHEFSGGQRQRIAIARALITRPSLVIADEPVSALDVSVQAQILNLMLDLRARRNLAYVFISHDLAVIRHMAHRVLVLREGRVVEEGETGAVLDDPRHAFTRALVAAEKAVLF